jgi:hypothetical protein
MKRHNCACGKVDLKKELNISSADITVKKNTINITITREPDTPLIAELRRQIAELQQIGLEFENIDRKLKDALQELDLVSKTMLVELLEDYSRKSDLEGLKSELKEWADSRFMRKMFLTQEAYDALEVKEENVLYCII